MELQTFPFPKAETIIATNFNQDLRHNAPHETEHAEPEIELRTISCVKAKSVMLLAATSRHGD